MDVVFYRPVFLLVCVMCPTLAALIPHHHIVKTPKLKAKTMFKKTHRVEMISALVIAACSVIGVYACFAAWLTR